jgi:hypothetical protein
MRQDSGEDPPDPSNLHLIAKSFDEFIESSRYEEAWAIFGVVARIAKSGRSGRRELRR